MKIVIATDSFKGSLSTLEAGHAMERGLLRSLPDASVTVCPIADGGEGTVDALASGGRGTLRTVMVTGPLGEKVDAAYGVYEETGCAVIEMSAAAGITLVPEELRDPMKATTYGVGELIGDAISQGIRRFIIGIGGSATNDGGVGMLSALGFEFLDADGKAVTGGAAGLGRLACVKRDRVIPHLDECTFRVACDVKNPLLGDVGCSAVYGPQKGGTDETIPLMDSYLAKYADITKRDVNPNADPYFPGVGAAGGMGFALKYYLGAALESGCELIMNETRLEEHIRNADLVITGEGRLDSQSAMGKVPVSVAAIAKKHGVPVAAIAGCVARDAAALNACGIDAFFPVIQSPCTAAEAMEYCTAITNIEATAVQIGNLIKVFRKEG